jgi:queuine/archaeosine tRNA-ribosyltransferase
MTLEEQIEVALRKSRFAEDIDLIDPPISCEVMEAFLRSFIIHICGWIPDGHSQREYYRLHGHLCRLAEIQVIEERINEWVGAAIDRKRAQPGYVDWPPF